MRIRQETGADWPAIARLNEDAFGGPYEAGLIERLRADELVAVSLVAVDDATIIGHILFSDLAVELDGHPVRSVSLAPMCVRSDHRRRGVGSSLVRAGLDGVRAAGYLAVIVVGHPAFYPRFGFSSSLAEKLASPFPGPAFMALELVPGALRGRHGKVTYPAAFSLDELPTPST
jgi:putative acetyltransferase